MEGSEEKYFCKNCKQEVTKKNFDLHILHCERKLKLCDRCDKPVNINDFKLHYDEDHVVVPCPQCKYPFEKWILPDHMESCPKRLIACQYCDAEFPSDKYAEHLDFCGSRTEKCLICQSYVMIKDTKTHSQIHLHPTEKPLREDVDVEVIQNCRNECISQSLSSPLPKKSDESPSKRFVCHICKQQIPWIDMNLHIPTCATNAGKCSACGEIVPPEKIKQHIMKQCPKYNNRNKHRNDDADLEHIDEQNRNRLKLSRYEENVQFRSTASNRPTGATATNRPTGATATIRPSEAIETIRPSGAIASNIPNTISTGKSEAFCKTLVTCPICKEENILESLFETHTRSCLARSDECPACHEFVLIKHMGKHISSDCTILHAASNTEVQNKQSNPENPRYNEAVAFGLESASDVKQCPYCSQRCSRDRISDHIKNCPCNKYECPLCGVEIPKNEKEKHEDFFCSTLIESNTEVQNERNKPEIPSHNEKAEFKMESASYIKHCPYCNKKCFRGRISDHIKNCSYNTYECPLCDTKMLNSEKGKHEAFLCTALITSPSYASTVQHSMLPKQQDRGKHTMQFDYINCPNCDEAMPTYRAETHIRTCRKNTIKCTFCKSDCHKDQLDNHLKQCPMVVGHHKSKVGKSKNKGAVSKHNSGMKMRECSFCKTLFNYEVHENHEQFCVHKPVKCDVCKKKIPVKDYGDHLEEHERQDQNCKEKYFAFQNKVKTGYIKRLMNFITNPSVETDIESVGEINYYEGNNSYSNQSIEKRTSFAADAYAQMQPNYSYSSNAWQQSRHPSLMEQIPPETDELIPCEFCNGKFHLEDIMIHSTACGAEEIAKTNKNVTAPENNKKPLTSTNSSFFGNDTSRVPSNRRQRTVSSKGKAGEFLECDESDKTDEFVDACAPIKDIQSYWNVSSSAGIDEESFINSCSDGDAEKCVAKNTVRKDDRELNLSSDAHEAKFFVPKTSKTNSKIKDRNASLPLSSDVNEAKSVMPKLSKPKSKSPSASDDELSTFANFIKPINTELKKSFENSEIKNVVSERERFSKISEGSDMDITPNLFSGLKSVTTMKKEFFDGAPTSSDMELTPNPCNEELLEPESSLGKMECDDAFIEEFPESDRYVQNSEARENPYEQYLNKMYSMKENLTEKVSENSFCNQNESPGSNHSSNAVASDKFRESLTSELLSDNSEYEIIALNSDLKLNQSPVDEIFLQNRFGDGRSNVQISDVSSAEALLLKEHRHTQPDLLSSVNESHLQSEPTFKIRADSFGLYNDLRTKENTLSKFADEKPNSTSCKYSKLKYDPNRKTVEIEIKEADFFNANKGMKNRNIYENAVLKDSAKETTVKSFPGTPSEENLIHFEKVADNLTSKNETTADKTLLKEFFPAQNNTASGSEKKLDNQSAERELASKLSDYKADEEYDLTSQMAKLHISKNEYAENNDDKMSLDIVLKDCKTKHDETLFNTNQGGVETCQSYESAMSFEVIEANDYMATSNFGAAIPIKLDNDNEKFHKTSFIDKQTDVNKAKRVVEIDLTKSLCAIKKEFSEEKSVASNENHLERKDEICNVRRLENGNSEAESKHDASQNGAFKIEPACIALNQDSPLKSVEVIIKELKLTLENAKKVLNDGTMLSRDIKDINAEYKKSCEKLLKERGLLESDAE